MTRRILTGAALVFLLGCIATLAVIPGVWKSLTDSAHVNTLAQQMADFQLPDGYQPDYAIEALGYAVAAYKGSDQHSHLVLMQGPADMEINENMLVGYVANDQRATNWTQMTVLKSEQRVVRGAAATITLSERINSEGQRYRQLNMVFAGKQGPVLLVVNQLTSRWNNAAIDAFIASIH